jgi:hypothetical protein
VGEGRAVRPKFVALPQPLPALQQTERPAERRQLTVMFCDLVGSTALDRDGPRRFARCMLPIPGTSSIAHLEENLAAASIRLSAEEFLAPGSR